MIFRLNDRLVFPDPELAEPDGLLAVGGDLSTDRLLLAYQNGVFPWYSDETPILWYSPHERFVIYADELKVSTSMRKFLRKDPFRITVNQCFEDVITACSAMERKDQDGTWITGDMINAYVLLHQQGYAHSIEVWQQDNLVGGMYGIPVGNVFCGESMFSRVSNASKAALIYICKCGLYKTLDCQMPTEHLAFMGGRMISRKEYMQVLKNGIS
jgi:leucyl/phenylalanyl-tRNA--protein transferase